MQQVAINCFKLLQVAVRSYKLLLIGGKRGGGEGETVLMLKKLACSGETS